MWRRGAGSQELAIFVEQLPEPRPVREQGLVRNANDRLHTIVAVGHEQPRLDQDVEKLPTERIVAQWRERHPARHDRLVLSLIGGDERRKRAGSAA